MELLPVAELACYWWHRPRIEETEPFKGLVVIGVLYQDQLDRACAFAAQMQASAWPDGMKIESLWLALDCVKLRDGARAGRADAPRGVAGREAGSSSGCHRPETP